MKSFLSLLIATLLLAGCKSEVEKPRAVPRAGPQRVTLTDEGVQNAGIRVEKVNHQTFAPRLSVAATIQPDPRNIARIGPRVAGRVAAVNVRLGDKVQRGQPLVEIEAVETHVIAAEFLTAMARAREANDVLERQKKLNDERIGAVQDLRRAEANAEAANATMRESEEHLGFLGLSKGAIAQVRAGKVSAAERSIVRAPIDGTVSRVHVSLGEVLAGTEDLLTIVNSKQLWASLQIYERDLPGLSVGGPVEVRVVAYPDRVFRGQLSVIGESIDSTTHTVEALALMNDPEGLRDGMTASASVVLQTDATMMWLPAEAVQSMGVERVVFLRVGKNEFEVHSVGAGAERSGYVPVSSGLEPDSEVVVQGAFALRGELARAEGEEE